MIYRDDVRGDVTLFLLMSLSMQKRDVSVALNFCCVLSETAD